MNKIFLYIICCSIFTFTINENLIQLCNDIIPNSFSDCNKVKFENTYKCCYFESTNKKICRTIKMDKWENIKERISLVVDDVFHNEKTTIDCDVSTRGKSYYLICKHLFLFLYTTFILL